MDVLHEFIAVCEEFGDAADFVIVYLAEAHPVDEAVIKDYYRIETHVSLEDRSRAVDELKEFAPELPCKVYMDSMKDEALHNYGSYPERLFIVQNGKVKFVGGIGPFAYSVPKMKAALKKLV